MPTRRSGKSWEAQPKVRQGSRGPPRSLGGVGRPNWRSGRVGRPTRWFGKGRESHPEALEGT